MSAAAPKRPRSTFDQGLVGGIHRGAMSGHLNVMLRCETEELAGTKRYST